MTYTVSLKLKLRNNDRRVLGHRFFIMNHIHNECESFCKKRMNEMRRDREYIDAIKQYHIAKTASVKSKLRALRVHYRLTQIELEKYAT